VSPPTPLLDFFKRGEVDRDVRLLAAAGALAPRAHEQLAILILLLDDRDRDVRQTALETLDKIPVDALAAFLARSDVPIGIREFFADRGVFPAHIPAIVADDPLIDTAPEPEDPVPDEDGDAPRDSLIQRLSNMGFSDRLKAALRGSREVRAILIRDPNKTVAASVLSSPKVTEAEVETFARMANVSEDVLRIIATNRAWIKNYGIVVGLSKNPKTPLGLSLNLLSRLNDRDVTNLSTDRNVPDSLRTAARRRTAEARSR
jgi:hypothetical protein